MLLEPDLLFSFGLSGVFGISSLGVLPGFPSSFGFSESLSPVFSGLSGVPGSSVPGLSGSGFSPGLPGSSVPGLSSSGFSPGLPGSSVPGLSGSGFSPGLPGSPVPGLSGSGLSPPPGFPGSGLSPPPGFPGSGLSPPPGFPGSGSSPPPGVGGVTGGISQTFLVPISIILSCFSVIVLVVLSTSLLFSILTVVYHSFFAFF